MFKIQELYNYKRKEITKESVSNALQSKKPETTAPGWQTL